MKRIFVTIVLALLVAGCGKKVDPAKLVILEPGMKCDAMSIYLDQNGIKPVKDGVAFEFALDKGAWEKAVVKCDGAISTISFFSKKGATAKEATNYIDAQTALMNEFRDSMITYDEGNSIINFNNGIKLHQFKNEKTGVINYFEVSVENIDGAKAAWKRAGALIPAIGAKK